MSMSFADLVGRIAEIGCDFRASREHSEVVVAVPTVHYVDPHDGEKSLLLHVMLQEEGRMLRICVPEVYAFGEFANAGTMAQAMLAANWRVRVASYVLDESDGEVSQSDDAVHDVSDGISGAVFGVCAVGGERGCAVVP